MKAQTKKIGYETPDLSVIYVMTDGSLLQDSLETQGLEDADPVDGSWK